MKVNRRRVRGTSWQAALALLPGFLPGWAMAAGPAFTDLVAGAQDARIVTSDPAGMSRLTETSWRTGLIVSYIESTWKASSSNLGEFSSSDTDNTLYIPALYYVRPLGERWSVGMALSATSGMGDDGSGDSVTRYLSTDWSVGSFTFMPSASYRVNDEWSLGVGLGVNYTVYSWEAALFNGIGQPDGKVELEPDDVAFNIVLAAHWTPSERTRFGILYRSEYEPNMKDSPDYSGVDPDRQSDADTELDITMPQSVLAGVHYDFENGHWASLDVLWIDADQFNIDSGVVEEDGSFTLNPYQLDDVWVVTAGWGMALSPRWDLGLGALYVGDPIDEENRSVLLRVDSLWGLGASLEWHRDNGMTVGANLSYLFTGDSPVELPIYLSSASSPANTPTVRTCCSNST